MSARSNQPIKTRIREMELDLKRRRRTESKALVAMSVAFVLAVILGLSTVTSKPFIGKDLLTDLSLCLTVLGFAFFGIAAHASPANVIKDVMSLVESEDVTAVPILAEYHEHFSIKPGRDGRERMRILRTRVLELLRAQSEAPTLEFLGSRVVSITRMLAHVDNQADRALLFNVIAKAGAPSNIGEIDLVVQKICKWQMKDSPSAKHQLILMAAACKAAIRAGNHTRQDSQSLLRPTDASDSLLSPSAKPNSPGTVDNLLTSSVKPEE